MKNRYRKYKMLYLLRQNSYMIIEIKYINILENFGYMYFGELEDYLYKRRYI